MRMKKFVVSLFSVVVVFGLFADGYITNKWTNADAGTTITNASLWSDLGNWESAFVPNGDNVRVIFPTFSDSRYVKIDAPITLNEFLGNSKKDTTPTFVSDSAITMMHPTSFSQLSCGRYFLNFNSAGKEDFGLAGYLQINGCLASKTLTLINQTSSVRLDNFAVSSNPLRENDFNIGKLYRGSGHLYIVGPRKGLAHEGNWFVQPGSPYLFREGTEPKIAAGAVVSCGDVFPAGAFVKRIFSDTCIELSAPAAVTAESGVKTIAFAAITPKTRITIPTMEMATWSRTYTYFVKYEADDDFEVEVTNLVTGVSSLNDGYGKFTPSNYYSKDMVPAKIIIHDAAKGTSNKKQYAKFMQVELGTCHLEFAETGREGAVPGIPDSITITDPTAKNSDVSRLSVTNNIHAVIGFFTNFYHVVQKEGAGTLTLGLTNNVSLNTGTLVVKEGTVVLPEGSWVKTIAVSNGATLRIEGKIAPEKFIAQAGAVVSGSGILRVPDAKDAQGVVFADGAALEIPGVAQLRDAAPATNVPSSVAFWIDASRMDTITFADELLTNVTRIADVRGESYGFATNTLGGYPRLVRDHRGRPHHINLPWVSSAHGKTDPDELIALIWDKPYTNIRAVFQVLDPRDGGGQFLGMTKRLSGNDFMRPGEDRHLLAKPIFYQNGCAAVRAGKFYINGKLYNPDNGYPYSGGGAVRRLEDGTQATWSETMVASAHPTSNTKADAFGFNELAVNRSGHHRVCECLIFTNEVTDTERLAITGYLMKKWMNHNVEWKVMDGDPLPEIDTDQIGALSVNENENVYVGVVGGLSAVVKRGSGSLVLGDYAQESGSIDVQDGSLTVNSSISSIADVPQGAYIHLDASDASKYTVKSSGMVSEWRDVRGAEYPVASAYTYVTNNSWATLTTTPRGMTAVNFGPFKAHDSLSWLDRWQAPIMHYPACSEFHTVFMVMDSSQGGGYLVGVGQNPGALRGPNEGYGINRFCSAADGLPHTVPIISSTYFTVSDTGVTGANSWSSQKNLLNENGSRVRLNGERVNPLTTGFSGGWDLVSLVSYENFGGGGFAGYYYNKYVGGQAIGEVILYKEGLTDEEVERTEAYLRWKWFGETTPKYRPAVVSNLTVRSGATLSVVGGAPLTVNGAFSVQGTVSGDVVLASGAELVVNVGADGSLSTSGFAGALDLSNGVKVRLCGEVNKLASGEYTIAQTAGLTFSASGSSVVSDVPFKRNLSLGLGTDGNALVLKVLAPGLRVIVR